MELFALEFSEKQQCWHYNFGKNEKNTNGYKTIIEFCSLTEAEFLIEFIELHAKNKLTYNFIFKSKEFTERLVYRLLKRNISFSKN